MTGLTHNTAEVKAAVTARLREMADEHLERVAVVCMNAIETRAAPYVPVDTANLITSAFRSVVRRGKTWVGTMGYGAAYAAFVHDGGPKNWQKAGASDKYLAKGLRDFLDKDLRTIIQGAFK
jgi:hypothetical protein